jgi:hypothetical protein
MILSNNKTSAQLSDKVAASLAKQIINFQIRFSAGSTGDLTLTPFVKRNRSLLLSG